MGQDKDQSPVAKATGTCRTFPPLRLGNVRSDRLLVDELSMSRDQTGACWTLLRPFNPSTLEALVSRGWEGPLPLAPGAVAGAGELWLHVQEQVAG